MGRKKTKNYYWTEETEQGIIDYNTTEDSSKKNVIYNEYLEYPFFKLTENIINTFKFSYFDDSFQDVQNECISFIILNMHKYDHTKGSKAFSYFSVVAKNYLILHNNNNYKKLKTHDKPDVLDRQKYINNEEYDFKSFTTEMVEYFDANLNTIFKKERDLRIGYAIVDLIKQRDEIENFNKKALYILIREMTNVETAHITSVVNVLKKHYKKLMNKYHQTGTIMVDTSGSKFF